MEHQSPANVRKWLGWAFAAAVLAYILIDQFAPKSVIRPVAAVYLSIGLLVLVVIAVRSASIGSERWSWRELWTIDFWRSIIWMWIFWPLVVVLAMKKK